MVGFGAVMDLMALLHLPLPFPALDSETADGKENDPQVKDKTEHNATQYSRISHAYRLKWYLPKISILSSQCRAVETDGPSTC